MLFKNSALKVCTTITVLVTFGWSASGGNAWAAQQSAQQDPMRALARLADNPHLRVSAEGKASLRMAARMLAPLPQAEPVRRAVSPVRRSPTVEMKEIAAELDQLSSGAEVAAKSSLASAGERVSLLRQRLEVSHEQILREFAATESFLREAGLPKIIFERHAAALGEYTANIEAVFQDLDVSRASRGEEEVRAVLGSAAKRLATSTDQRPEQPLDPALMPFRRASSAERGLRSRALGAASAPTQAAAPFVASTPGDLMPNQDVQITPEIQALAASLGNQPLRIYNWVRENIEFVPTYGSVQGSQLTLEARRGNAFDTSSLLIALFRAAGVPARYVTGTTEIPVAAAMNWVGGAGSPAVAQQLLGQGGVPTVGLVSGGEITHLRIEHVWVEAAIDNIPSRGAVHRQGDTWLSMDASFKLHTFAPRSNLFSQNPVSVVVDPGESLFEVDESLGKVTNVDDQALRDRLGEWVRRSEQYLWRNHGAAPTLEDLVGQKIINQDRTGVFASSMPYRVLERGAGVSTLASTLRHSLTLKGFGSEIARALGATSFSVSLSLPEINSRRLSLQFEPATQADADTLEAARNSGASSLPVYLVDVVPVIKLDGVERGRGESIRMGSPFSVDVVLQGPGGAHAVPFKVVAGDEIVVGATGNGVTREVIEKRFAAHLVDNASEHLHQVQLHYWMESDFLGQAAAKARDVHMLRLPSVGFFSSPLVTTYIFGSPRSGFYQGRTMDVRQSLLGAAGANPAGVAEFMKQAGFFGSYLEGSVFDQLRSDEEATVNGVSAVRIIDTAMALGVPIYHVTSANVDAVLPLLSLSAAVENDIATAVGRGKTVLAPESNIEVGTWAGAGYIIQDEATGAGAYMISGGLAGGASYECDRENRPVFKVNGTLLFIILFSLFLVALILAAGPALAAAGTAVATAMMRFLIQRAVALALAAA